MTNEPLDVIITAETFYDLGLWLSEPHKYSKAQLARLQNEDDCLPLIALANRYWLIGRLTDQLLNSDVWSFLPSQLTDYLTAITEHYQQRGEELKLEAENVSQLLASNNTKVLLLKSSAGLLNGLFTPLSRRFMYDIDLLVPEDKLANSVATLKAIGYEEEIEEFAVNPTGHQHAAPLKKEKSNCFIELHRWPLPFSIQQVLTTDEVWQNSTALPNMFNNKNIVELSATYQVILTIAHSELVDKGYEEKHIELRQLTYLYDLIIHAKNAIDWHIVEQHFIRANQLAALQMSLYQLNALFHLDEPINALKGKFNKKLNKKLASRFKHCLNIFEKTQGTPTIWQNITYIFSHYQTASILDIYGNSGNFPVVMGRLKLFWHHLKSAINVRYLVRVVCRILNKENNKS